MSSRKRGDHVARIYIYIFIVPFDSGRYAVYNAFDDHADVIIPTYNLPVVHGLLPLRVLHTM